MGLGVNLGPEQLHSRVYKYVFVHKRKITKETSFCLYIQYICYIYLHKI